jgi:hypothetical protein
MSPDTSERRGYRLTQEQCILNNQISERSTRLAIWTKFITSQSTHLVRIDRAMPTRQLDMSDLKQ